MQTPSVRLTVQCSFQQIPHMTVTEAVLGSSSPRAMCLRCIKRTDNMKPYAQATWLKAQLSLVNWCAIWMFHVCNTICFGMHNKCLYVPCDIPWYAQQMFVCTMWYTLVCTTNVCMYHVICLGVQNECLCVPWDMLWYTQWIFVCTMLVCCVVTNLLKQLSWHCNTLDLLNWISKLSFSTHSS